MLIQNWNERIELDSVIETRSKRDDKVQSKQCNTFWQ